MLAVPRHRSARRPRASPQRQVVRQARGPTQPRAMASRKRPVPQLYVGCGQNSAAFSRLSGAPSIGTGPDANGIWAHCSAFSSLSPRSLVFFLPTVIVQRCVANSKVRSVGMGPLPVRSAQPFPMHSALDFSVSAWDVSPVSNF